MVILKNLLMNLQMYFCIFFIFKLAKTVQGHDGQLFDSTWRHKGKRYLCFTREVHCLNFMIFNYICSSTVR